jgi:hypothetical protein
MRKMKKRLAALLVVCITLLNPLSTFASANKSIPNESPVLKIQLDESIEYIDPFIGIYEWTYYNTLYYGTAANPTNHFVGSWTKTQTQLM